MKKENILIKTKDFFLSKDGTFFLIGFIIGSVFGIYPVLFLIMPIVIGSYLFFKSKSKSL